MRLVTLLLTLTASLLAQPTSAPVTVRVMSYNIHHAEGLDGRLDVERIAKVITDAKADIVGLQEVDRGVERTHKRDLPAELAKLTGLHVHFEKNIDHQGGEYGNATLSRFPIIHAKNTHYKMVRPGERRGLLQLTLDVHGREVLFLNTHLEVGRDESQRLASAEEIVAIVAAAEQRQLPVILVGDFNAVPESRTITHLKTALTDTWERVGRGGGFTIPVRNPTRRIDFIFITPKTVTPLAMSVLASEASDHLPIVAELRLN